MIVVVMIVIKRFTIMNIENTQECFVQLWLRLERTRRLLGGQYKRFCIRNVMKTWFGYEATDIFIWEVCRLASMALDENNPICGNDYLPIPCLYPRKHREFLRAIVSLKTGISIRRVNQKALDKAYSIVFPKSTPININKKLRIKS